MPINKPLYFNISIIIPVYNAEKYINDCFESILSQTLKNFEVIFVDDGSTDSSAEILKRLASEFVFVRVLTQDNAGPGSARNIGIKEARGEYIVFIDVDDRIEPEYIENLYNGIISKKSDLLIGGYWVDKYFNDELLSSKKIKPSLVGEFVGKEEIWQITLDLYSQAIINSPWAKIFHLSFLQKHNIFFDRRIKLGEDLKFVLECMRSAKSISIIDNTCYHLRRGIKEITAISRFQRNYYYIFLNIKTIITDWAIEFPKTDYVCKINRIIFLLFLSLAFKIFNKNHKISIFKKNLILRKYYKKENISYILKNIDLTNLSLMYKSYYCILRYCPYLFIYSMRICRILIALKYWGKYRCTSQKK